MRIVHFDRKLGEMKIQAETLDDMWHLEKVISEGDLVESRTMRTYKVGTKEEKKPVTLRIRTERAEFAKNANRLRILGIIVWGNPEEYAQLGRHHTIEVAEGDRIKIIKGWKNHEIKRLQEAEKESKRPKLRIIVMDDEKALTATLRAFGVDYGPEFRSSGSKKDDNYEKAEQSYFGQIAAEIERHEEKYVIAGPGFAKDNLKEFIKQKKPDLLKRIIFESVSYAERNGVSELFKKGVIEKVMGEERLQKEMSLVDEMLTEVYKDSGMAVYGLKEVAKAAGAHAIGKLLVLDEYIRTDPDAEKLAEAADRAKADVVIVSSEGEAGEKLKGFGKIGALLRFKIRA